MVVGSRGFSIVGDYHQCLDNNYERCMLGVWSHFIIHQRYRHDKVLAYESEKLRSDYIEYKTKLALSGNAVRTRFVTERGARRPDSRLARACVWKGTKKIACRSIRSSARCVRHA